MKSSFTICGQYSSLIVGSTVGQSIGSRDTTSSKWSRPDHEMYLVHFAPSLGEKGSVAMNHCCMEAANAAVRRRRAAPTRARHVHSEMTQLPRACDAVSPSAATACYASCVDVTKA